MEGPGAALGPGRMPVTGVGDRKLPSAAPGLGREGTGCTQDVWMAARWTPHLGALPGDARPGMHSGRLDMEVCGRLHQGAQTGCPGMVGGARAGR